MTTGNGNAEAAPAATPRSATTTATPQAPTPQTPTNAPQTPTTPQTPLASARGLTKHYRGFTLDNVDITVPGGEIVGFIGQNGAGKSTTIKAMLGIVTPDAGAAQVLGVNSTDLTRPAGSAVKEHIGAVFDSIAMPAHLSVADAGRIYARAYRTWDATRFARLTADFGLDSRKTIKELSRGMGMKLGLACALCHDTRLLLLDEATAGLDPMARDEVLDLLRGFVSDDRHAVFMSSHITSDLEHAADRIVCIDNGRIIFDLPKDDITDTAGIARCRADDLIRIADAQAHDPRMRVIRHDYESDVLVPDRYSFTRQFPDIPCDRMTIDDYMALTLKGSALQ